MTSPPLSNMTLSSAPGIPTFANGPNVTNDSPTTSPPTTLSVVLTVAVVICPVMFICLVIGFCRISRRGPLRLPLPTWRMRNEERERRNDLAKYVTWGGGRLHTFGAAPAVGNTPMREHSPSDGGRSMTPPLPLYTLPNTSTLSLPRYTLRLPAPPPPVYAPSTRAPSILEQISQVEQPA